jgi:hypothetical protein
MNQAVVPVPQSQYEVPQQLTASDVKAQVTLVQQVMRAVMQEGFHYGVIPGTEKPTLLKPGAEKLTMTFRLAPELTVDMTDLGDGHREYRVKVALRHIVTGQMWGEGVGSCSTMESRYRYRNAALTCPHCGQSAIIKGRAEYGGGWLCFGKKGGCGAKFSDNDSDITNQATGRVENPDISDTWNTALKMAKKRALVDATLTATAASDCFNQDLEDFMPEPPTSLPAKESSSAAPLKTVTKPDPQKADTKGGMITEPQRKHLYSLCSGQQMKHDDLKRFLAGAYQIESTTAIPTEHYDLICQNIADGTAKTFLTTGTGEQHHPEEVTRASA